MTELPDVMPAAVYQKPGVVTVEERPVPRARPRPDPDRGRPLRHLRLGHPHAARRLGPPARADRRSRVLRRRGRGRPTGCRAGRSATSVVCGPSPKCGRCRRCLEGQPSQCENRDGPDHGPRRRGLRALRACPGLVRSSGCPRGSRPAMPRSPSPWPSPSTASPARASSRATRRWSSAPDRSAPSPSPSSGPGGSDPIIAVEPGDRRKQLARDLGADEVLDPGELERFDSWEPERIAEHAVHVVLECSGKKAGHGGGLPPAPPGRCPRARGRRHRRTRPSTPTVCCSTSSPCAARSSTTRTASSGPSSSWRPETCPTRPSSSPRTSRSTGSAEALEGLATGRDRRQGHGGARACRPKSGAAVTHPYYPSGNPHFNHVAMSVPADLLDEAGRRRSWRFSTRSSGSPRCPP